jgi:hypothetical protein
VGGGDAGGGDDDGGIPVRLRGGGGLFVWLFVCLVVCLCSNERVVCVLLESWDAADCTLL